MKIKRMLATCLAGIVMVSAMAIPASAAPGDPPNHTDTTFSFNFSNLGRSTMTLEHILLPIPCVPGDLTYLLMVDILMVLQVG